MSSILAVCRLYYLRSTQPLLTWIRKERPLQMHRSVNARQLFFLELLLIAAFCFIPLLWKNPYRLNIFLSWEGAYRIFLGQMPFKDYSLPMGYGYWVIPALFFKIFGPFMHSLIKAQAFINVVSLVTLRSTLRLLGVKQVHIFFTLIVFCFSYVSWNFWPWYNHLVIVLEMVAIHFALLAVFERVNWKAIAFLALSAFFIWFSIWTKQDGGTLGTFIIGGIILYDAVVERRWKYLAIFAAAFLSMGAAIILPIYQYDFAYWFNYGQPPHNSRLVVLDFLNQILGWAYWEKFFLLVIGLLVFDRINRKPGFLTDKKQFLFAYLCVTIILQALIIQVTSYEPPNGEDFFYAFGFVYIISNIRWSVNLREYRYLFFGCVMLVFWWSGFYWRNLKRVTTRKPVAVHNAEKKSRQKYRVASEFRTMDKLFLSESTIDGIHRIKSLPVFNTGRSDLKVLNMSELTTLAWEVPFTPLTDQPLWFHQGVSIFQKEVDEFCRRIESRQYDVVIFETIPESEVINFFPMDVKACLERNYKHEFTFLAPRTPEESFIDVYTRIE